MTPIYDHGAVTKFVVDRYDGAIPDFDVSSSIGVQSKSGELVGGVVFTDWNPDDGTIQMSGASASPFFLSRSVLGEIAGYVFGACACQLLWMKTTADNTRTRRLFERLGANEYVIPRLNGLDRAAVIITLTAEAWASSKYARYAK